MRARRLLVGGAAAAVASAAVGYAASRVVVRRERARPDPHADHPFEPVFDLERAVTGHDGTELHVVERGRGIPVLMGHGVTIDRRTWVHQLEDLPERGIRAIVFDQRGHGRSSVGHEGFGLDQLADDLRSLVEELDLRDAVLVGHSMGGMGLQAFAARHPEVLRERVAGLVLMSTVSHSQRSWGALARLRPGRGAERRDARFVRAMSDPDIGYLLARYAVGRGSFASHVDLTRRMVSETAPRTRMLAVRALARFDLRPDLAAIPVPTLVVCGTRDRLTPARASRSMAQRIPDARLELLEDAGHMPMFERAEEVSRLLADFAREVGSGARPEPRVGAAR